MSKVTICSNEEGQILIPSKTTDGWSSMMVQQSKNSFSNGVFNTSNRVAFVRGETVKLQGWIDAEELKSGSKIDGSIVVFEQTTPFYEGQEPKIQPADGDKPAMHLVTEDGEFIYRNAEFFSGVAIPSDELIAHASKVLVEEAAHAGA